MTVYVIRAGLVICRGPRISEGCPACGRPRREHHAPVTAMIIFFPFVDCQKVTGRACGMTPAVPISFSQPCRGESSRCNSLLCIRLRVVEVTCSRSLRRIVRCPHTDIRVKMMSSTDRSEWAITGRRSATKELAQAITTIRPQTNESQGSGGHRASGVAIQWIRKLATMAPAAAARSLEAHHVPCVTR